MIKKLAAPLVLVAFVALASMGISYAEDREVYFSNISSWDNDDATKNIGYVNAYYEGQFGDLIITISNAYPHYEAYVYFTINYINQSGTDTVWIKEIDYTNIFPDAISLEVTYPNGDPILDDTPITSEIPIDAMVTISMKDGADQDSNYWFDIDIKFSDEPPA